MDENNEVLVEKKVKSVFANKDYFLLFMGFLVSNLGNTLYNFAISYYIYSIASPGIAGLYLATGGLVYFIIAPFGGAIVDRLNRVKVLWVTDYIRGITILAAGYILMTGISNQMQLVLLFTCTIILAINGALFGPASSSLPANILEKEQLQQANSVSSGANALYMIVGAFAGAAMYEFLGIELVFIVNGASFVISAISEMFIKTNTNQDPDHVMSFSSVLKDIKFGWIYLKKLKPIFYLILFASLLNFFTTPTIVNGFPYLFKEELQVSAFYYSLLMSTFPLGIIVASIILGVKKQKEKIFPLFKMGMIGMTIAYFIFVIGLNIHLEAITTFFIFMSTSVVFILIMGIFNGHINIPFGTAIQINVEKDKQGRVFAVLNVISMGLTPISIGIAGYVIEYYGILTLFYIAVIAQAFIAFFLVTNKYVKQL